MHVSSAREIWLSLNRHRMLWLLGFITILGLVAAIGLQLPSRYLSSAQVIIDWKRERIFTHDPVLSELAQEAQRVNTEEKFIGSEVIAERVVSNLKLDQDPEFNGMRQDHLAFDFGWIKAQIGQALTRAATQLGRGTVAAQGQEPPNPTRNAVASLLGRLDSRTDGRSRIITVYFYSNSAQKSAAILSAVVGEYLAEQAERKSAAARRAADLLGARVEELRAQVVAAEDTIDRFRRDSGLVQGREVQLTNQQLSESSTRLIEAINAREDAESRVVQLQRGAKGNADPWKMPEVLKSSILQKLREDRSTMVREISDVATTVGDRHPRMIAMRQDFDRINKTIADELQNVLGALRQEAESARAREEAARRNVDRLSAEVLTRDHAALRLRQLERDIDSKRDLMTEFRKRLEQTAQEARIVSSDARIMTSPNVPIEPYFPRMSLLLLGGSIFAGLAASGLALLVDHRRGDAIVKPEEVSELTPSQQVTLLPQFSPRQLAGNSSQHGTGYQMLSLADGIRSIHVALMMASDTVPKSVAVTSALPNEGKTTIALALATGLVRQGLRILIIDTDYLRPSVHTCLGMTQSPGLAEYMQSRCKLANAIRSPDNTPVHVITTGDWSGTVFRADAVVRLIQRLQTHYDFVIVDTGPVLGVSETKYICGRVDASLLVVKWDSTTKAYVRNALEDLGFAKARIASVILNMVNRKRYKLYGSETSGLFAELSKYYPVGQF